MNTNVIRFPVVNKFTLKELAAINPEIKLPNLSVKVNGLVKNNTLKIVGYNKIGRGRPTNVYSLVEQVSF